MAFSFLELSLRGMGLIENFRRRENQITNTNGGTFTIGCYGNSYTQGAGAPPGEAYCDHLRNRIAQDPSLRRYRFQLINFGRSNANSSQVLAEIERSVDRYHIDLALIMTGEPNSWNKNDYGRFLKRKRSLSAPLMNPVESRIYSQLYFFRTFRLFSMLLQNLSTEISHWLHPKSLFFSDINLSDHLLLGFKWFGAVYIDRLYSISRLSDQELNEALSAMTYLAAQPEGQIRGLYSTIGRIYLDRLKDPNSALLWYKRALSLAPNKFDFDVYRDLQQHKTLFTQPGSADATEVLKMALQTYPGDESFAKLSQFFFHNMTGEFSKGPDPEKRLQFLLRACAARSEDVQCLTELEQLYFRLGRIDDAANVIFDWISRNPFSNQDVMGRLNFLESRAVDINLLRKIQVTRDHFKQKFSNDLSFVEGPTIALEEWIQSDIEEMIRVLQQRHAKFLLQTYPPKRNFTTRPADRVILQMAAYPGYPLSDTLGYFNRLFKKRDMDRESFYSQSLGKNDDHLNSMGYRVLAEFLFESIRTNKLFPNQDKFDAIPEKAAVQGL